MHFEVYHNMFCHLQVTDSFKPFKKKKKKKEKRNINIPKLKNITKY